MESNNIGTPSENYFVCNEPSHRKSDCPIFKASLVEKGINPADYHANLARRSVEVNGGGPHSSGQPQWRGGGPGRGAPGSERGRESWRGSAARGNGRSAQAHAVSVSWIRCLTKGTLSDSISVSC